MNKLAFSNPTFVIKYVVISKETVTSAQGCCLQRKKKNTWGNKALQKARERQEQPLLSLCVLNLWEIRQLRMAVTLVYIEPWRAHDVKQLYWWWFTFFIFVLGGFLHLHQLLDMREKIVCWLALFIYISFNAHFFKKEKRKHKVLFFNYLLEVHNEEVLACFRAPDLIQFGVFYFYFIFWSLYYYINPVMHFFLTQYGDV